jgi:hypothetical protein
MFLLDVICNLRLATLALLLSLDWERDVKVFVAHQIIWRQKLYLTTISLLKIRMVMSMVLVLIYGHSVFFFITLLKVKTRFIMVVT